MMLLLLLESTECAAVSEAKEQRTEGSECLGGGGGEKGEPPVNPPQFISKS